MAPKKKSFNKKEKDSFISKISKLFEEYSDESNDTISFDSFESICNKLDLNTEFLDLFLTNDTNENCLNYEFYSKYVLLLSVNSLFLLKSNFLKLF